MRRELWNGNRESLRNLFSRRGRHVVLWAGAATGKIPRALQAAASIAYEAVGVGIIPADADTLWPLELRPAGSSSVKGRGPIVASGSAVAPMPPLPRSRRHYGSG